MKIETGDFVVFHYVGKFENGEVFDTSYEDIARENEIYVEEREYGPLGVNVGVGEISPALTRLSSAWNSGRRKPSRYPLRRPTECPTRSS